MGARIAGNELADASDFDGAEGMAGGGIESPGALGGAAEAVAVGDVVAGFIEPEFAFELQAGGAFVAHAAEFFFDLEGGFGVPEVDGELAPGFGKGGLGDVDGSDVAQFDEAELGRGAEGDQFAVGEGGGTVSVAEGGGRVGAEGGAFDEPFAGADLGFEAPGVVDGAGNGGVEGAEQPAFGEEVAEGFLAAFAGYGELDFAVQEHGGAVFEDAVDLAGEKVAVGRFGAGALEPEGAIGFPIGGFDGFSIGR